MKLKKIAAMLTVAGLAAPAFATNGMNMEGYGPIATSMGGASMAYDNGTAGLINNPATLALMKSGTSRINVALGGMHPDVNASRPGQPGATSEGNAYYMPAMGYVRKDGSITWGIGMMAQGGMGTEYGNKTFLSGYRSLGGSMGASGQEARTELGLGRVMFPLVFDVSDSVTIGGTFDYLWGGLDLKMPMSGAQFGEFMTPGNPGGSVAGSMVGATGLPGVMDPLIGGACAGVAALGGGCIQDVDYSAFDFSEGTNKMSQRAQMTGTAFNLGFTWKATPQLSIGGVYHAKTNMSDMTGSAKMVMQVEVGAPGNGPGNVANATQAMTVNGKIKVINFQWPETIGFGMSYQASDKWQVVADYKSIRWSDAMKQFRMQFTASDGMFAGQVLNATINQNWHDQNVFQIGAAYKIDDGMTVRFGANMANSAVNAKYLNPLFPAISTNHFTFGLGTKISKTAGFDFSLSHAPKVSATNSALTAAGAASVTSGVSASMAQTNWQAMFSNSF